MLQQSASNIYHSLSQIVQQKTDKSRPNFDTNNYTWKAVQYSKNNYRLIKENRYTQLNNIVGSYLLYRLSA